MEPSTPSSKFRSFDIPKPEETGLAEWTSRIKALQRQVDADEEAEQKRLEAEIQASRIARMRRSHGVGSRNNSLDLCESLASCASARLISWIAQHKEFAGALKDDRSPTSSKPPDATDRVKTQEDALRRLTGASASTPRPSTNRPEPMSLAAFMGGSKAAGPPLKKHAPQQDAHDPTQFEQRTRVDAPHPIFGKGGVAMPGMVTRPKSAQKEARTTSKVPFSQPTESPRSRTMSQKVSDASEARSISPQKTGTRERTMSTPTGSVRKSVSFDTKPHTKRPPSRPTTPSRDRAVSPPGILVNSGRATPDPGPRPSSRSSNAPRSITTSRESVASSRSPPPPISPPLSTTSFTSRQSFSSSTSSSSPRGSNVSIPSLARPIRPEPRTSQGPVIPPSSSPSPAFLKAPAPKDPTPSISRLQGRGFVQNMVKKTLQQDAADQDRPRPTPTKKSSVLDRWHPENAGSSSPSPPIITPKPVGVRKSWTAEPASGARSSTSPDPNGLKGRVSLPGLAAAASAPARQDSLVKKMPPEGAPGLGSKTTVAVIRPPSRAAEKVPEVDEMGFIGGQQAGKPLIHTPQSLQQATQQREARPISPAVPPPATTAPPPSQPEQATTSPQPSPGANGRPKITDRWTGQGVIGVKAPASTPSSKYGGLSTPENRPSSGMVGKRALPGLTAEIPKSMDIPETTSPKPQSPEPRSPVTFPTSSTSPEPSRSPAPGQHRHTRIPSTGNRATVMDLAQVFNEQKERKQEEAPKEEPKQPSPPSLVVEPPKVDSPLASPTSPKQDVSPESTSPRMRHAHAGVAEKRRSQYEAARQSSVMTLPPLKEEATPAPTPVGTMKSPSGSAGQKNDFDMKAFSAQADTQTKALQEPDLLHVNINDGPLPKINAQTLLQRPPRLDRQEKQTISVEVLQISGNNATAVPDASANIFYDNEVLAIIHRHKSKKSGLVDTTVWGWKGAKSELGEREEQKLQELAKRYHTEIIWVDQFAEPSALVEVLGGQLSTRQGSRTLWSSENTAMHVVRSYEGVVYIDELDFNVKNLCSGFSYCFSILNTQYVWHGRGSTAQEREAALQYAKILSGGAEDAITRLTEGEDDQDEMFWAMLGDEAWASADYWQWRKEATNIDPRVWLVEDGASKSSVFVVDCIWEYFVVVGHEARGKRKEIRQAVTVAMDLATLVASERPFHPTVHVLVLPSQLPLDLKLTFRGLDDTVLNGDSVPDHMNLLSSQNALTHDTSMLPLGVDAQVVN
uniref:Gelsolin-like domain-containing protein n=1 Tax=Schizophyllum commune (strain H4-8 / FGSC 9210) TaxID=578458 RepID=D8QC06_SCHCM